ncbi:3965_t:CDS:2, partial [Acaulospora colombiana]
LVLVGLGHYIQTNRPNNLSTFLPTPPSQFSAHQSPQFPMGSKMPTSTTNNTAAGSILPAPTESSPLLRARYSTGYNEPIPGLSPASPGSSSWTRYITTQPSSAPESHEFTEMPALMSFISLLPPPREISYDKMERLTFFAIAHSSSYEENSPRKTSFLLAALLWLYLHPTSSLRDPLGDQGVTGTWDFWKKREDELKGRRGEAWRQGGSVEEVLWTEIPMEENGRQTIRDPLDSHRLGRRPRRTCLVPFTSLGDNLSTPYMVTWNSRSYDCAEHLAIPFNITPTLSVLPYIFVASGILLAYPGIPTPNTNTHALLLLSLSLVCHDCMRSMVDKLTTTLVKGLLKRAVRPGMFFFGPVVVLVGMLLAGALGDHFPLVGLQVGNLIMKLFTEPDVQRPNHVEESLNHIEVLLGPSHPQTRITLLLLFLSSLAAMFTLINCLVTLFPGSVSSKGVLENIDEYEDYHLDPKHDVQPPHVASSSAPGGRNGGEGWKLQSSVTSTILEERYRLFGPSPSGLVGGGPWERYGPATAISAKRSFANVIRRYQHLRLITVTHEALVDSTSRSRGSVSIRKPCGRIVLPPVFNALAWILGAIPATILRLFTDPSPVNTAAGMEAGRSHGVDATLAEVDEGDIAGVQGTSGSGQRWRGNYLNKTAERGVVLEVVMVEADKKRSEEAIRGVMSRMIYDSTLGPTTTPGIKGQRLIPKPQSQPNTHHHRQTLLIFIRPQIWQRHNLLSRAVPGLPYGIAVAFKRKYPEAYEIYHNACLEKGSDLLGTCLLIPAGQRDIACLFTSERYGRHTDPKAKILRSTRSAVQDLMGQTQGSDKPMYGW